MGNQAEVPARSERMKLYSLLFLFGFISASPLPQDEDMPPMPYQFTNRVSENNAELDEEDRGISGLRMRGLLRTTQVVLKESTVSGWLTVGSRRYPITLMANLVLCRQSRTLMDTHRSLTTKPLQLRKASVEKEVLFKQNSTIAMDIIVDNGEI